MVHPTCAPARPQNRPPAGENPPLGSEGNLAALAMQATAEVNAVRQAYQAVACVRNLLEARSSDGHISRIEVEALVAVVSAEFERRMQTANATIASMPVEALTQA